MYSSLIYNTVQKIGISTIFLKIIFSQYYCFYSSLPPQLRVLPSSSHRPVDILPFNPLPVPASSRWIRHGLDCLLERATPKPPFTSVDWWWKPLHPTSTGKILTFQPFCVASVGSLEYFKHFLSNASSTPSSHGTVSLAVVDQRTKSESVHPVSPYWPFLASFSFSATSSLLPWRVLVPLRSVWTEPKASSPILNLTNHVPEMKCWLCIAHGFRWCPLSPEGPLCTRQDLHSQWGSCPKNVLWCGFNSSSRLVIGHFICHSRTCAFINLSSFSTLLSGILYTVWGHMSLGSLPNWKHHSLSFLAERSWWCHLCTWWCPF